MANETVEQARLEPMVAQSAPETRSQGLRPRRFNRLRGLGLAAIAIVVVGGAAYIGGVLPSGSSKAAVGGSQSAGAQAQPTQSGTGKREVSEKFYKPTDAQWQTLGVETAKETAFRTWLTTDGKIAINEDNTTPVFSPYAGRVIRLLAKPGDHIEKGKPLFVVEASDMVQGQNDFLAARANVNKAKSQLDVATVVLKRHRDLVLINAVAKRELEQAEIGHVAAVNDLKSAEVALEAARNRLRILGKTDAEVADFEQGRFGINAETTVNSPLSGTIVQRKVGPGQFVTNSSNDPVFVIGDLSTVWLIGNVRETDATKVAVGQPVEFTVLAQPEMTYRTTLSYLAAAINPDTHRLQVRAEVANPKGQLRPEMFANVAISIGAETKSASVPRHALIYEGDNARLWVVRGDKSIELRRVVTGVANTVSVQILSGLEVGEQFVAKGALFIDRLASPVVEQD